jgi:antitoxin component YwqK of YwqJK toxin-antitoxin module
MLKPFTFLFFLAFTGGLAQAQVNQTDANGKRHGSWSKKYENGQVRYLGEFNHGIPVNTFKYYFDDGSLRTENVYRGKTGVCLSLQYGQEEKLAAKGIFKSRLKDSVWTYFDANGVVIARETFVKDQRQGKAFKYFANGRPAEIVIYQNGVKEGPFTQYYESGKLMAKGQYKNGKLHGEVIYYFSNGRPRLKGNYVHGVMNGTFYYFGDNLKLEKKEVWRNGFLQDPELENNDSTTIAPVPHY